MLTPAQLQENKPPPTKWQRIKRVLRLLAMAFAGLAMTGACRLLPHPFHIPCEILAKLAAALSGVAL